MNTNTKILLAFVGGLGLGILGTNMVMKAKYEEMVQEEINDMMAYNQRRRMQKENKIEIVVDPVSEMSQEEYEEHCEKIIRVNNYSITNDHDQAETTIEVTTGAGEKITYQTTVHADPHIITADEYNDDCAHHDKITISYYAVDDTLADEREEVIADVVEVIGEEALLNFGEGSDDPDIVYVRNPRLGIDYEVVRMNKSFQETVLGLVDATVVKNKRGPKPKIKEAK